MSAAADVVRDMVERLNAHDVDGFCRHYSPTVEVAFVRDGRRMSGREQIRAWMSDAFEMIDDLSNEIIGVYADGDVAVLEVVARGRRDGDNWQKQELYVYELDGDQIVRARCY